MSAGDTQYLPVDLNPGATQDHNRVEQDGFLDDDFAPLDLRSGPESLAAELSPIADEHPEFAPTPEEVAAADGTPAPVIDQAAPPVEEPSAPAPEQLVYEYPDGAKVIVEKTSKGWKAELSSPGVPKAEVFYGKTKDELFASVAYGKVNATQKIRQLNKEKKLAPVAAVTPAAPTAAPAPAKRELTADEIFQIKTQLDANPAKALETAFQLSTGLTFEQLVALAQQGKAAKTELDAEGVAKAFINSHPDYYPDPEWENYRLLIAWIAKYKAGIPGAVTADNADAIFAQLGSSGHWTIANLNEAYDDLDSDGLLKPWPANATEVEEEEEETAAPVQVTRPATPAAPARAVTPAPADSRIVNVRRSRAGMGLRQHETTTSQTPANPKPPSAEGLDDLSDAQISQLFADVRRTKASARR